jgi:hypothetical protein
MEVTYQKEKNVINMKTSFALLFLFLLSISGKLYAQEAYIDYHLLIKEIVIDVNEKSRIKILNKIMLDFDWIDKIKDSVFVEKSLKYKCNMLKINSVLKEIDFNLLKKQTSKNKLTIWDKSKLGKTFKVFAKPTRKHLTHQYSIPLVQNNAAIIRIKSFQYNLEVSDYIFILEKTDEIWEEICIIVLSEVFV